MGNILTNKNKEDGKNYIYKNGVWKDGYEYTLIKESSGIFREGDTSIYVEAAGKSNVNTSAGLIIKQTPSENAINFVFKLKNVIINGLSYNNSCLKCSMQKASSFSSSSNWAAQAKIPLDIKSTSREAYDILILSLPASVKLYPSIMAYAGGVNGYLGTFEIVEIYEEF